MADERDDFIVDYDLRKQSTSWWERQEKKRKEMETADENDYYDRTHGEGMYEESFSNKTFKSFVKLSEGAGDNKKSLADLSPDEIESLPDRFTCVTRTPGATTYSPVFQIVSKTRFIETPDKCFFIDSYWGYAYLRDVYLATYEDIEKYEQSRISAVKNGCSKYKSSVVTIR